MLHITAATTYLYFYIKKCIQVEILGLHELNIPIQVINNISYAEKHSNKAWNNITLAWKHST